ncbi:hypothetical protein [Streptomyces sp. NPDC059003]|uniref:hypothetical protein n=1 Tax=Streptomyces sp. NPDC059003 TaxID=3346691 RepID=UPI003677B247
MSSSNTTNQERVARALNRLTGCGYQKALQRVRAAAAAGQLPAKLDHVGRDQAVRELAKGHSRPDLTAVPGEQDAGDEQKHQVPPDDLLDLMMETHQAAERLRALRDKERTVAAMRAQRDERLNLERRLERGGEDKTVISQLARLLGGQQGADRVLAIDMDPLPSSLGWLRHAAALSPEPGYKPVFVDVNTLPSRAPELTPREKEELLRQLTSDDPQ